MARRGAVGLSLFWRTFFLLALLLAGGIAAWVLTLRALELEPRAVQAAQQTAGLVNLARAALRQADGINRLALIKSLTAQEATKVTPREPQDRWEDYGVDAFTRRVSAELKSALGPGAVVARNVNGTPGMWVGFSIDRDLYWLQADAGQASPINRTTWLIWVGIALLATLLGSVAIASLINRPLKQLSFAASRIRDGDLDSRLDENTLTSEIREVNKGFNRMARELARVEEDRAVMLAGISHDLRTPLARLRLETEMSVSDEEAKRNMALDIDQLDAIIDKFMDYARPGETQLRPVSVAQLIDREAAAFRDPGQIKIQARVPPDLEVMADETELGRVFLNLFENARRYGRGTYTGVAEVSVSCVKTGPWAIVSVRDHGPGVAPEKLPQLTTPFFRGDAARTAATGAGLGLAIVDKAMHRMAGNLELANAPDGGLVAHLRLKRVPSLAARGGAR
ncbi:MAG: HAMP domain-containing protein [Burkholderiales bacterium]|nr:HAMP domain-containing protein [Burkholderiales bacterium]MDE2565399.1 HAMP domain-containing protein [Burkholderiales bacterium]